MERKQSVVDQHELLAMVAKWELLSPMKFPSPAGYKQFIGPLNPMIHQYVNHICYEATVEQWVRGTTRTLEMVNAGCPDMGVVGIAQCLLCGCIYWERIVCRQRLDPDHVCCLPRYHAGPCKYVNPAIA